MLNRTAVFPLIFFICSWNVSSHDINVTEKKIEAYLRGEYNRTYCQYGEISSVGAIELDNRYTLRGGISSGMTAFYKDINTFINTGYSPFLKLPLNFSVSYIYNGLPEFKAHTHSIMPVVSYNARRAGVSIGSNFRLTSFFGESAIFESILSFYCHFNFINNNALNIGVGCGNFDDFHAKNMGAYSLNLYAAIRPNSCWSIINEIELMQSGGDGLATTFYGFACRAGVKYTW